MVHQLDTQNWPLARSYRAEFPNGNYDETSHLRHIYAPADARVSSNPAALFVGSAGTDGIEFALRPDHDGIWAFYPNEGHWEHVAKDFAELDKGWRAGQITV